VISFRFHLVSIAGIFLALALGIVLGTTVLNEATVNNLEGRIKSVRADIATARAERNHLKEFTDQVEAAAVAGRLDGVRIFTIVPEGASGDVRDRMRAALVTAGAIDAGTLTLDDKWADDSPPIDDIAAALGVVGPISIESVTDAAAERLAADFDAGSGTTLPALVEANFMRVEGTEPAAAPGAAARYVVIDDGPPAGLLEPLARALATKMPARVLVADASADDLVGESLVGVLRSEPDGAQFSTVDHIQTPPGRVTAILALSDFGRGVIGDYGSDDSADRAAPAAA
jgi:hypothetical protein